MELLILASEEQRYVQWKLLLQCSVFKCIHEFFRGRSYVFINYR